MREKHAITFPSEHPTEREADIGLLNEMFLLLEVDPATFDRCVKGFILMEAEAEIAKARIEYIGRVTRLKVARELNHYLRRSVR